MLAVLSDAMAAGKEIATPVIERAFAALSSLADAFEANPSQTEDIKAAATQAREMANRLSQYTTTVTSVTNGQIPSLSSKEIIGRIKAGVDAGTIDFMENTPEEIAATFSDIMDGKDVSEEDAKSVSDFLYGRYKQIMDIRTDLQNKIEEESSPEKKAKLKKSVQAINDVLARLNADIEASVKYQQEKALQDEAAGTRKKAPLGEPAPAPSQEQAPEQTTTPAQEFDPGNIDQVAADYQQKTGDVLTEKMATALKTVAKLLAKVAPNVKFYVHSTTQEFIDAVKQEGVTEDLSDRAGTVVQSLDGKIESLHINLELALGESAANQAKYVYHEAAHVLLDVYFRSDYFGAPQPGLILDMADEIRSALPNKFKAPLAEFVARYRVDSARDRVNREEESIAELIDMLANDESKLDKPTIVKIIAVINKFITAACKKLRVDPEKYLLSNNRSDLIDFVNSTSRAVKSGLSSDLSEKAITRLQRKYAVQEQTTGEVPVQSRTKAGRTLAKGESKTGPKENTKESNQQKKFTEGFEPKEADLAIKARELLSKAKDELNKNNLESAVKNINSIKDIFTSVKNIVVDSSKIQSKYGKLFKIFPQSQLQQGDVVLDTGASKESVFVRSDSNEKMGASGFRKRTDLTKNERTKTINGEPVVVDAIYRTSKKIKDRILEITSGKAFVDDSYLEITGSNEAFHKLISKGRANLGALGQTVLIRDKSAYKDMRLFVSEDGTSGFALTKDNRLISVWNDAKSGKPRRLPQIMYLAIQEGASKLECFDTGLVDMYANYGFRPIGRFSFSEFKTPTPWVDEYGNNQSGWQYEGEPDIVYMVYDGGNRNDIAFNIEATSNQSTSNIPWVDKNEIGEIQEYIATGNPVIIKNNEPKNEGKKTKAGRTAKKFLKPNDLFQINASPFYRTSLSDFAQAESLHRSMGYNAFLESFQNTAENFNVKIVKTTKAVGGWAGESEVTAVFDVKGNWDDVVSLATVMGAIAPEVQDSTIAGQIVKPGSKDHIADRWDIEVDDPSIAFKAIREVSFEQDGYTISGNTVILLDFGVGDPEFVEKTLNLIRTIEQYGGQVKSREKKALKSDLISDEDGRRQEAIERLKESALQREGDRGSFYSLLEKASERINAFVEYKKVEESPEASEVALLRKEQLDSLVTGEEMPKEKIDRLNKVSDAVVERLIPIFTVDESLYSKAKKEIETIAQDALDMLSGEFGFVSEFGIKRPSRAAVKTVRWYDSMPTRLGDGARTNIIVNTEPDADFIFNMMSAKFTDDLRRREFPKDGTELGYPKRLIEIMTKSGKLAEVQVMTPHGYLAKDGVAEFPVDKIQYAVDYLSQIRDILGWQIPDGVGHYFYEIHRDPQVSKKLRDQAEVISTKYYKAMLKPDQSTLTDEQFRDEITDFKTKVDAADKSNWDRGNLGIAPSSLNDYLENRAPKTAEQYVKEKEAKEKERSAGKKTKAGRTKSGSFKNGYDPNEAADRGNQEDRDLQKRIYDTALEVWDSAKDLMDMTADIYEAVEDKLGVPLNPIHIAELVKDLRAGTRPEYSKTKEGKYKRSKTRLNVSSVMDSALEALSNLSTNRRVDKGIISSLIKALKGGPQYTVENQMDIDAIADALFDIFGGSANITTLQELYNIAEITKGGLRSSMFARIANDAWNKARESKDQQEKLEYRNVGNKALMQLAQEATEAGRFNAMIYRIQKLNPEFLASFEKSKAREETESQMRASGKKKSNVVSVTTELNTAQTQAADQAVNSPSVQASINAATGTPPGPSTPPPAKKKPSTTKTPPAPKPPSATPSPNKEVDARIKDLKGKLKNFFGGKKTKAARVLPAGMEPELLDIITELARNYIQKGFTDRTALISKINGDITAAGGSVTMNYFTEMWSEVQAEAVKQRNTAAADSLANRIVGKVKGAIRTSTKTFDPIAELVTDLVNKATEDVETPKKAKESPLEKIKRLLEEFDTARELWIASKAKVEAKIDGLDPQMFTLSEKAEMKDMLDAFFENDLSYFEIKKTSTPAPDMTVRNAIKQEMKDKKFKIEEVLLMANSKKAATKDEFIQNIVDDIVLSTGISYSQAAKIAEDFANKYDQIVTKKQESILKKRSSQRRVNNIKKKSQGQRAFEMIKYGALDPSIEIHDKDGNIIDSAMLLAELFGVPYLDDVTKDALDVYAEAIADTPEGVIRQQVINDMMMFMKMHQYRQLGALGDRIMAQFYANLLTSTDTLMKAFNSNVLMNPFEYLAIATRAAVKRDFALIPLLTRGFYQQKGVGSVKELKAKQAMSDVDGYVINQGESYYLFNDKTVMSLANPKAVALSGHYEGLLRYSASINQARGVLENIVTHENFTNNVTGAVYEKHAKTKAGRTWGKYVTLAQKGLGALDALATAGATGARYSDLLYDAIRHYAKIQGVKIKGSEIVKVINLLQGYSPMIQLDAYNQAIAEMESVEGGPVDLSNRNKKTLLLLRVEEIVRDKMKDRYQQAVNENDWLSALGQQEISDMLDEAKDISTKIGLMGTAPGTGGVLSHLLGLSGKAVRFSNMQYGAFTNAPVNAASFVLLGNTPLGALVTGVRLLKSERGLGLGSDEFFKKEGIRTKMYGKTSAEIPLFKNTGIKWNLEKQDMLTKFVLIQAPVIGMTYMAANAVMVALASMYDDDEEGRKNRELLLRDGIEFLRTVPQKDRELMFFGDPLSPDQKKKDGVWKTLPFYTTGAMYGYADGGYGKMQSLRARFGVEPYTVYAYGRKIFSYKDNPLLGAFFMEMAASTDALLFNESANLEDTQLGMIMVSTWSQLNLIRDQSNLRSISEVVELLAGQRAYEGLDGYNARAQMYLSKTAANILSNLTLPAEMKNLNQDIMAMVGQYMDDPKQFHEFVVYRWPIIGSAVIEGDKTGPFGYPLKVQPKRIFPIGTEQFKLPLMLDGTLDVPTIDQLLSTEDAQYTALFERNKNDKFLKPGISGYYKLDKYGDYEKHTFTLDEQKKIREEYKLIMREFAAANINKTQSPELFDGRLKIFLQLYGSKTGKSNVLTMGYKRYIINKVMGAEADNIILDKVDGVINMNVNKLLLDEVEQIEEGFEPLPR
jgi:hypothetical protein